VTATVRIPIFDRHVEEVAVTDDPVAALERADAWPVGVVPEREGEDRYVGYDPDVVDDIATADVADLVLVKADGARTREFKAPNEREPQLPPDTSTPSSQSRACRPSENRSRPTTSTGRSEWRRSPGSIAATRSGPKTSLECSRAIAADTRGVPDGATVVPLLNKVDDAEMRDVAADIGRELLERAPAVRQVVLARMVAEEPVIDVLGTWFPTRVTVRGPGRDRFVSSSRFVALSNFSRLYSCSLFENGV